MRYQQSVPHRSGRGIAVATVCRLPGVLGSAGALGIVKANVDINPFIIGTGIGITF